MPQIIAVDYGTKKTGIATTDDLQMIASPLQTVPTHKLFDFLTDYFSKNEVVCVVVGRPLQRDGTPSPVEPHIKGFIKRFVKKFPTLKVARSHERYTSKMARQVVIESGLSKKKRRDKTLIDKISAAIILQDYLQWGE